MILQDTDGAGVLHNRAIREIGTLIMVFLLLGVALIQIINLGSATIFPTAQNIWSMRHESSISRSAIFLDGIPFAEYVEFVRSVVPEDAKLILPPREPVQVYSNQGVMQFYFMPRELHNCGIGEGEECILRLTGPTSYIITAWKFPPDGSAAQIKEFIPFKDGKGIYAPKP